MNDALSRENSKEKFSDKWAKVRRIWQPNLNTKKQKKVLMLIKDIVNTTKSLIRSAILLNFK
jgi:ribosomal protein L28